jgi:dephospho-CoA kinase
LKVVGITGRTGSGKSTLAGHLAKRFGCPLIGADELGHAALNEDPRIVDAVRERFGSAVLDSAGRIDRRLLASIVFSDSDARCDLNAIVHPWIIEKIASRLAAWRQQGYAGIVLIDAALLLDWTDRLPCDRIVFVRCSDETAIGRLAGRGIPEAEARRRLASQDSEERFLRRADIVVANDGAERELEEQLPHIWESLNAKPKERNR